MPNTSSSVPFLLSSSMQSIRSRRTSGCMSTASSQQGSTTGLLQQIGSGVVRQFTFGSSGGGGSSAGMGTGLNFGGGYFNGNASTRESSRERSNSIMQQAVRKCPSLNITFTD